jgi:hypothetical protein
MVTNFRNWRSGLAGLFIGAAVMGWLLRGENEVNAEVRKVTPSQPDQHFKSGGRLSEGVLQEILIVLKRMDDRLARIEATALPTARGATLQAMPATDAGPANAEDKQIPEIKVRRSK